MYAIQVIRPRNSANQFALATIAFHDGDVSSSVLTDMVRHAANVVPQPGRENVLSDVMAQGIGPYIVTMWTDTDGCFERLHAHLLNALPKAYAGYMTFKALHRRDDFESAVSQQLFLTPATEFVSGHVTPGTEKYLA